MARKMKIGCKSCNDCKDGCKEKSTHVVVECDECGYVLNPDEAFYDGVDGCDYCWECLIGKHQDDFLNWAMDNHGLDWCYDNFDTVEMQMDSSTETVVERTDCDG